MPDVFWGVNLLLTSKHFILVILRYSPLLNEMSWFAVQKCSFLAS
jgi:hypothetical protein